MNITVTSVLDSALEQEIHSLLGACHKKDADSLSFPFEEDALYVLVSGENGLVTAAAFLSEGDNLYECAAFTHPAFRKRGFFLKVLEKGLSLLPPEAELLFYAGKNNTDTRKTLDALGAELISEEHMMELSMEEGAFLSAMGKESGIRPLTPVRDCFVDGARTLFFSNAYGSVKISVFDSHYYLYGFEIQKTCRNQGHGTRLLLEVLSFLSGLKRMPVFLQVSGDNLPALALYEKTGFRISETLSCFLY